MRLSARVDYALRAAAELAATAADGKLVTADRLASAQHIPPKFLESILLQLRRGGVVVAQRGPEGGYRLARPAGEISLAQIIRIIDGPLAPIPCVSERAYARCEECADEATCGTRLVMKQVRDAIAKILDNTTLASALEQSARARRQSLTQVAYAI